MLDCCSHLYLHKFGLVAICCAAPSANWPLVGPGQLMHVADLCAHPMVWWAINHHLLLLSAGAAGKVKETGKDASGEAKVRAQCLPCVARVF